MTLKSSRCQYFPTVMSMRELQTVMSMWRLLQPTSLPSNKSTLPFPVEEELKSTGGVQQQIAHQTHHDDTKTTNLDPILNQTSADEFRPNLDLTLAPPVVACEGNQAPTMGLFGTEAENFNPRIVLNLGLTLAPPKVN
ncbi:hypothetical protein SLEP1_g36569 [Rubroshorea leprosula]|uniref:Uncharacterized protein n=1 Tax=Rubroshorea leprosula TaxID=152421 RepID=A0AAV5KRW0_9ROSI|nr:hypothetical protein SLEP1_g36569 [Rubroshorea leprosula]